MPLRLTLLALLLYVLPTACASVSSSVKAPRPCSECVSTTEGDLSCVHPDGTASSCSPSR